MKTFRQQIQESFTKKDFDRNEDRNLHALNALMLAKKFGTSKEVSQVKQVMDKMRKQGYAEQEDTKVVYDITKKYARKLTESDDLVKFHQAHDIEVEDDQDSYEGQVRSRDMDAQNIEDEKDPCWDGYTQLGMKTKDGKQVPNCVKEAVELREASEIDTKSVDTPEVAKLLTIFRASARKDITTAWDGIHGVVIEFRYSGQFGPRLDKDIMQRLTKSPVFRWIEFRSKEIHLGLTHGVLKKDSLFDGEQLHYSMSIEYKSLWRSLSKDPQVKMDRVHEDFVLVDKGSGKLLAHMVKRTEIAFTKLGQKMIKTKKLDESQQGPAQSPAAPAVVSGGLRSIGFREKIHPKFAMLLKDTSDSGTELRLLVTYPNGESALIPSADKEGAQSQEELLMMVVELLGDHPATVDVVKSAIMVAQQRTLAEESSLNDKMQLITQCSAALRRPAMSGERGDGDVVDTGMTKVQAIECLKDLVPHSNIVHALMDAGHAIEEVEQLLHLGGIEMSLTSDEI